MKPKPTKPPAKPILTIGVVEFMIHTECQSAVFTYDIAADSIKPHATHALPTDMAKAMTRSAEIMRNWAKVVGHAFDNEQSGFNSGCGDAS